MKDPKTGWALVLAGGGARGAFQAGVLAELARRGFAFDAVAGTSVGAINGILAAQGRHAQLPSVWRKISKDVLKLNKRNFAAILGSTAKVLPATTLLPFVGTAAVLLGVTVVATANEFRHQIVVKIPTPEHLESVLASELTVPLSPGVEFWVTLSPDTPSMGLVRYFLDIPTDAHYEPIHKRPISERARFVMASAALPFIYGPIKEEKSGIKWIDGGISDNEPVKVLYERGYRRIIYVGTQDGTDINDTDFPEAQILHFLPSQGYHGLLRMLDFSPESVEEGLELGRTDAARILDRLEGLTQNLHATRETLEDASESLQRSTAAMDDWSQRSAERTTATAAALTQLRNRILHQD